MQDVKISQKVPKFQKWEFGVQVLAILWQPSKASLNALFQLSDQEPCDEHGVPYVLALYSFDTPASLTDAYERLHSVTCT